MAATVDPPASDWLRHRAELSPTAVAIIDLAGASERSLSYAELEAETNQVAHWLRARGIGRGERVAILAKNRLEYLLLWFACGKLGAVMQALNWRLTAAELAPILASGQPRLLLWEQELGELVASLRPQLAVELELVDIDAPAGLVAARELSTEAPPRVELHHSDPWLFCYTGGTTGLPKAAVLTHGNVTWNAVNTVSSWQLSHRDCAILNAPMFHIGGLNVFTSPLIHAGGCSILCRSFDLDQLYELIATRPVTCFFGVPAMFQSMQAHPRWADSPLERLSLIISGGAPCPMPVFERFWARGIDFKTGYGLTEAGPNNFWLPPERVRDKPGAVGWPLMHVDIRVVDDEGAELPRGEVGELWIRGPHVVPGYFEHPTANAETFVDGWLRTGDLVLRDDEGCVTIIGRRKDMIISGGENIYPAEVESVLSGHASVAEVAVVGVPDARWGEVGRAFVSLRPSAELSAEALLDYGRERLAKYKLPKSVVFLPELPRTSAGKLDKRALATNKGDETPGHGQDQHR